MWLRQPMLCSDCKACGGSNPTTDTVKVNPTLLAEAGDKAPPPLTPEQEQQAEEARRREADERRVREEEEERLRREAEEHRRREEEQERLRREAEERAKIEREQAQAQARELQRIREEAELAERAAEERAAAEEAAKKAAEDARLAEEAAIAAEREAAKQLVDPFLKSKGFKKGLNEPKKSFMKTTYALHVAVEENKLEIVEALLLCGADKSMKNSKKQTPLELAQKLDKKGSHMQVMAALSR